MNKSKFVNRFQKIKEIKINLTEYKYNPKFGLQKKDIYRFYNMSNSLIRIIVN